MKSPSLSTGAVVRLHDIPDLELARIEDRCGYKLEDALAALSSQCLTEGEIRALKAESLAEPEEVPKGLDQENASAENEPKEPSAELILKASQALTPKLTLFLVEIVKAAMVPNPDCTCGGKGCDECNVSNIVEDLRSFSVMTLGMAAIGASTASWKEIEDFFSAPKEPSGAELSA
ncbi:MAG: hypothetical protein HGA93_03740 [Methanothrix sp.]|nr:hypothetical protein [Methanothrix sp.]